MDRLHYTFTKQEAKPVTSPLIEVRETYIGPYTTPDPIVKEADIEHIEDSDIEGFEQQKGKIYKTKKEFIDEMTNAYTKELLSRGLDPMFAKYLVAQDGLESNWGKSSLGYHFNYGGIKEVRPGKGVAKPTKEFLNGKMEKVSGNFREFASLQDYVKYKVGLLNNSRYRAFSSHPGEFIYRVVGGGYATDPAYVSKFNSSLRTLESIRQFKSGGKISVAEEMRQKAIDYLIHNKERLLNSYNNTAKFNLPLPSKLISNALVNFYINKLKNLKFVVDDSKVTGNGLGAYDGGGNVIYLKNNHQNDRRTIAHELGHVWTDENSPSYRHFVNYINSTGGNVFAPGVMQDKLTSSEVIEILAEKAADSLNKPLGYKFTNADFEDIQNSNTQDYTLVKQNGFLGEEYKFNNDKKPMSAKSINSNGEGVVHRKMKPSFSKMGSLNEEALNVLYNLIAQNNDSREKDIVYAREGIKMSGVPYANLIDDPKERYNYSVDETYDFETKHYVSRDPKTGLVLKGIGHPTRRLAFKEDQKMGYDWYEGYDGNTYSYNLFEAAGKPIFNTPMKEYQVVTGTNSKLTLEGLRALIGKYKNKHHGVWTDDDIKYFYDKIQTSGFLPEAIAYVTATESSFNPRAKSSVSTAAGLGQLTDSRMKQLLGSNYKEARKQYDNGTRSIKDQIDDLMLNIAQIDGSIKDSFDNFGYGRLKMNYLKPSWSINRPTLDGLDLENNLTKDQRTRITKKSSVRDLIEEYDNEFNRMFINESK